MVFDDDNFTTRGNLPTVNKDDAQLISRVEEALKRDPQTARLPISVTLSNGTLELRGSVRSYYLKQMVQEVIFKSLKQERRPFLRNLLEVTQLNE